MKTTTITSYSSHLRLTRTTLAPGKAQRLEVSRRMLEEIRAKKPNYEKPSVSSSGCATCPSALRDYKAQLDNEANSDLKRLESEIKYSVKNKGAEREKGDVAGFGVYVLTGRSNKNWLRAREAGKRGGHFPSEWGRLSTNAKRQKRSENCTREAMESLRVYMGRESMLATWWQQRLHLPNKKASETEKMKKATAAEGRTLTEALEVVINDLDREWGDMDKKEAEDWDSYCEKVRSWIPLLRPMAGDEDALEKEDEALHIGIKGLGEDGGGDDGLGEGDGGLDMGMYD